MNITASQQTNIEIRRDVFPPRGSKVHPESPVAVVLDGDPLADEIVAANERSTSAYAERVAVHGENGTTAERDEANIELRAAELAEVEVGERAVARASELVPDKEAELDAETTKLVERELAHLDKLELALHGIARKRQALRLVAREKSHTSPMSSVGKIAGGDSVHNLRVGLRALLPPKPVERISQAEFRRRRDAGEDMSGFAITHTPGGRFGPTGAGLG